MIQPNRLTAPGEAAARDRVEAVYAAADRLGPDDLRLAVVPRRDPEEREVLLADLERVADAHGRGRLLDEARGWLRDALMERASSRWTSVVGVTPEAVGGRPEDQVEILLAIEDAVSVAVTEDLVDPAAAAALANQGRLLLGIEPLPGAAGTGEGVDRAWEPSAADWSAAAAGGMAVTGDTPVPAMRPLRAAFFGVVAVVGVLTALAWGATEGALWLGGLVAVVIVAVCWTLATWRPLR